MVDILPFFIILAAGLLLSEIFNTLHLPWVIALIAAGIIIGPSGFDIIESNQTTEFLAEIGLVFLMFMAGLESRLSTFKENRRGMVILAIVNGFIPFLIGIQIALLFGYSLPAALLLGTVFISSSIAVVIPSLSNSNLLNTKLGKTTLGATMTEDILSLVLLSILLQTSAPITIIPLPLFYILVLISLLGLRRLVPKFKKRFPKSLLTILRQSQKTDLFQNNLRLVITILLGTVIIFEILGLHPIVGGFFAGLILSENVESEKLIDKLRIISYGVFIPIFFVAVGLQTDFTVIASAQGIALMVIVVILGSTLSKFLSGYLGGLFSDFDSKQSALIGASSMPQLTTTLAVAFAGREFGLFDEKMIAALVLLSLISTIVTPFLMSFFISKMQAVK